MASEGNAPCTMTRVLERTAQRIAAVASKLEARANAMESAGADRVGNVLEELRTEARELRQCAYQLTGKTY